MWRLWTAGWGPRYWWHWFKDEGFPMWVAWRLPRQVALWAFVRVHAADCHCPPDESTYCTAYRAWEEGAGR